MNSKDLPKMISNFSEVLMNFIQLFLKLNQFIYN